jgi:hypothetical protein
VKVALPGARYRGFNLSFLCEVSINAKRYFLLSESNLLLIPICFAKAGLQGLQPENWKQKKASPQNVERPVCEIGY